MTLSEFYNLVRQETSSGKSPREVRSSLMDACNSLTPEEKNVAVKSKVLSDWILANRDELHQIISEEFDRG